MDKFKEILNKLDPEKKFITESVQNDLVTLMEEKQKQWIEEGYKKASKKYSELDKKHANKVKKLVEKTKTKYEKLLEKMDEEHANKVEKLFEAIDSDHAKKMNKIVEAINEDHTSKLNTLVEAIDSDHTKKLDKIVEHYENGKYGKVLAESIDDFLDTYLEEVKPKETLVNESRLNRLEDTMGQLKEILMINDNYIQTEIKEAVMDAQSQIEKKDTEIDDLMFEKVEIKKQLDKFEAKQMLSEKTEDMSPKQKAYIEVYFKNADKEEIEEKLNEAVKAFKEEEKTKREEIIAEANSKRQVKRPVIKEEKEKIVENKENVDPKMAQYISTINKNKNK